MKKQIHTHPCFNKDSSHSFGRVHLPVAPKCNIQCRFCDRQYDCVNESRPGVTSTVLTPKQGLFYLKKVISKYPELKVMGIAGPGDPFANSEETLETLKLVSKEFPELLLCVATNGLELYPHFEYLEQLGLSHLTITINAIDPEIGQDVYSWARYNKKVYRGKEAAKILLDNQIKCLEYLKDSPIIVKVNSIVLPGINDHHIKDIAKKMKDYNVDLFNAIPFYPNPGSELGELEAPDKKEMHEIQKACKEYLPQMTHCQRCRADAIGKIFKKNTCQEFKTLKEVSHMSNDPFRNQENIAVASLEGILVNQHLGEAKDLYIYKKVQGKYVFSEKRPTPPEGGGDQRWQALSETLSDCKALFVSGVGEKPKKLLKKNNIRVLTIEGLIGEAIKDIENNRDDIYFQKKHPIKFKCGSSCSGSKMGCM